MYIFLLKHSIEMLTSWNNQACIPHKSRFAYNLNSDSCCVFYYRALMHVKILKSTCKANVHSLFSAEWKTLLWYSTSGENQMCAPYRSRHKCNLNFVCYIMCFYCMHK